MSYALIARRAGVAEATVSYLARGLTKNLKRDRALRILAVAPAAFDASAKRPAFRTIRRLRALYAIGHNPETIAAIAGLDESTISHVANGRYETVWARTEEGVRTAYTALFTIPGTSWKAKYRANKLGWPGPLAWDDIDDPTAQPDVDLLAHKRGRPAEVDAAEVARLTRAGLTTRQIAEQLDCHQRTVTRARGRIRPEQVAA